MQFKVKTNVKLTVYAHINLLIFPIDSNGLITGR